MGLVVVAYNQRKSNNMSFLEVKGYIIGLLDNKGIDL